MTDKSTLHPYIETRIFGERPHVRGRRIPVATLAHYQRDHGWDAPTLADEFSLSLAEVHAALDYYAIHQTDIEAQEALNQAELEDAYRRFGAAC